MLGFLSNSIDTSKKFTKDEIYFVSVPDGLSEKEVKVRFAKLAVNFANKTDSNVVYLNYGKDKIIKYEYDNSI